MTSFLDTTTTSSSSSMMANTTLTTPETGRSNQLLTSQLRTATMVLTGFNILAALCMGFSILWDARKEHKRRRCSRGGELGVTEEGGGRGRRGGAGGCEKREGDSGGGGARGTTWGDLSTNDNDGEIKERGNWWTNIPAAGVFPLALAVAVVVQGIMLIYVESKGLDGKSVLGSCKASSEVTWTALWIPPFTVLSFGLDVCIRTISQPRFRPRPARSLLYCIASTLVLTILTWIPSRISTISASREQDICVGSLTSYVEQFSTVALAILCTIIPLAAILGGIIFRQLSRGIAMEYEERISASRMVSFMFINILQWILIIPYFAYMAPGTQEASSAFLATVIINISGITAHILNLYFRANTKSALIGPQNAYHNNNSDGELLVDQLQAKDIEASPTVLYNAKKVQIRDTQQKQQGFSSKPDQNGAIRVSYSSSSANSGDHLRQSSFSRQTLSSFRRLSQEITALLAGIRATTPNANNSPPPTPSSSKYSSPSLKSSRSPNYLLFPPSAETERYRERNRAALGPPTPTINIQYISTSTENTLKSPSPSRANTFKQPKQSRANVSQSLLPPSHQGTTGPPPSRPSRDFTPPINMDRKQGCTNLERQQSLRSIIGPPAPPPRAAPPARSRSISTQSHSRTTSIPNTVETFELPIALAPGLACKHKILPPPPPIEVAIPPPASASSWHKSASSSSTYTTPVGRIDEDAESFQEILKWR